MEEPVATPTESRTDEWRVLNKVGHLSPVSISKVYGVAHSQVKTKPSKRPWTRSPLRRL
jgi:hypothetical protein